MKLYTPNKDEAEFLLSSPTKFLEWTVCKDALPPTFLIERALMATEGSWLMPRLFCDERCRCIVGSVAFKSGPKDGKIELGYGVAPECRGRGYATMGVLLLVEEAFDTGLVDEVIAETVTANLASKRVLEKAGFSIYESGMSDKGSIDLWAKTKGPIG